MTKQEEFALERLKARTVRVNVILSKMAIDVNAITQGMEALAKALNQKVDSDE